MLAGLSVPRYTLVLPTATWIDNDALEWGSAKIQRAKAIRFSTLTALCDVLECTPRDLFGIQTHRHPRPAREAG